MEIQPANSIPCKVDGQPAIITGYGEGNAGPAIDYRLIVPNNGSYGPLGWEHWIYCGSSRLTDVQEPQQHDWHVADYRSPFRNMK